MRLIRNAYLNIHNSISQYLNISSWVESVVGCRGLSAGWQNARLQASPGYGAERNMNLFLKSHFGGLLRWNTSETKKIWLCHLVHPKYVYSSSVFSSHIYFSSELHFWLIMTSLLTGSVAFAGFVIAAETYRSYKEKVKTRNIRNWIFLQGLKLTLHKFKWALKRRQI